MRIASYDYKNAFCQSIGIAFNRSATQIATIVITSILGLSSTKILAEYSLALSFAAILFVIVTTIQLGVQAEFGRRFFSKDYQSLNNLFISAIFIVIVIAFLLAITVTLIPNPFSNSSSEELALNAYQTLKILTLCLPLVGILTTITYFLESSGRIKEVSQLRFMQIWLQVSLVFFVILAKKIDIINCELSSSLIAYTYVISDLIMLAIGIILFKSEMRKVPNYSLKVSNKLLPKLKEMMSIFKLGFPVMFGMIGQRGLFYLYANFAASFGIIQASVFTIANSLIFFLQVPILGVAHLMTIRISRALGERNSNQVIKETAGCTMLFLIELAIIATVFYIFKPYLLSLFTLDKDVVDLFSSLSRVIFLFFFMNAALTFSMSALRGFSDTLIPQLILVSLLAVGVLPCYFIFSEKISFSLMFVLFSASGFTAAYFLIYRMSRLKRTESINMPQ